MKSLLLWLGVFLCISLSAFGQDSASITGTVTDQSGAAVPDAQVTVSSPDRGIVRPTTTNSSGDYLVAGLPSGPVNVSVLAKGFKKYEVKGVILQVGQKARADVALEVGAAKEEVTVEGSNVAQVETQSSDLAGTVNGKQITELQLNGRNFTQLITMVPGVSNQSGQDEGTVGINGSVAFSVNGGRTEYNNWELDGGDNMDNGSNGTLNVYPSLEAIAEFKVLTSNYGAQYGRNGSGTVEVETKSGTNRFHGNAYEFLRNDAFNAFNYFDDPTAPKPGYKKNDFGYTIGGPIWKNKTFFFWSQEWRRDRVPGQVFSQFVPTDAERAGNFSDLCPNPTNNDFSDCPSVPGFTDINGHTPDLTIVPAFQANQAVSQALLGMIPNANAGQPGAALFNDSPVQPTNWREELIRVDHNLTEKQRVTFRYIHDSWQTVTATPLWTNQGSFPTIQTDFGGPGVSMVARLSSTFTPTLLNEFVASYTTDHIILNNVGNWQRPATFPMGDLFPGGGDGILPGINLSGGNAYGGGFGQDAGYIPNGPYNSNPTYSYRDNISKIIGKHNLQFGAYFVAAQKNELGGELAAGSIPGYLTFDSSNSAISSGNPFADLLLGNISSFGQQNLRLKYYNRYKILEPYFQDDWRVTSHLTLNLGLRLSLFGTYREKQQQAYNFDPAAYTQGQTTVDPSTGIVSGNLFNGLVQCGVGSIPAGCMKGHLFNPAPRIGFAYDPWGNGKTAIRGGYGIFFEHGNGNESSTESLENSPPLAFASQQNNIQGFANIGGGAGSASPPFPLSVTAIPTKAIWPYVQQWHFDVQHEVLPNTVMTVSYVGSKGTKLARLTDLNQLSAVPLSQNPYKVGEPIDGGVDALGNPIHDDCGTLTTPSGVPITGIAARNLAVACGTSADPFRRYQGYADIASLQNAASSTYHALQVSVRRSVGQLQVSGAYTYSHSIDDASDRFDASFVDSANPSANRASSNFDERHIFTGSYIWDMPFFKGAGLANKVLGGWGFSGIASLQSGTPFSPIASGSSGSFTDNAGVGNGLATSGSRPDIIGDPRSGITQPPPQEGFGPLLYNPAAYALPRGLTFGDAGRNTLLNPHRINFDMALSKRFVIRENMAFEFRAEGFNVFNHTQFGAIAGDSGSGANAVNSDSNKFPSNNFLFTGTAHNARILQLSLKFVF